MPYINIEIKDSGSRRHLFPPDLLKLGNRRKLKAEFKTFRTQLKLDEGPSANEKRATLDSNFAQLLSFILASNCRSSPAPWFAPLLLCKKFAAVFRARARVDQGWLKVIS